MGPTPDFIEEILREAEIAEAERKLELDRIRADHLLMAVSQLEERMQQVNETAEGEIFTIEQWRGNELPRLDRQRSWLVWNLTQFIRQTGEKTIRLPHGELKLRKGRDRAAIVDEEKFLPIGQKLGLTKTVPESVIPDLRAILDWIRRTGEIPSGVEFIPAETKFHYSINGGNSDERHEAEG